MRAISPYVLHQIARFGFLTIRELLELTEGKCGRSELYESLRAMIRSKLIARLTYSNTDSPVYQATEIGVVATLGETSDHPRAARSADVIHSLRVAQTLIALSRYEFITGFGTEFEIPLETWREFAHSKVPDGLVQVSRGELNFELAVEVEVTPKSRSRSQEFVNKYQDAFTKGALCSGVILVCDEPDIFDRYRSLLQGKGESLTSRFLVLQGPGLPPLNSRLYGESGKSPGFCADQRRTSFGDEIKYLPVKSRSPEFLATRLPPEKDPLSGKQNFKENLQPITSPGT